jgi:hypothetical protein
MIVEKHPDQDPIKHADRWHSVEADFIIQRKLLPMSRLGDGELPGQLTQNAQTVVWPFPVRRLPRARPVLHIQEPTSLISDPDAEAIFAACQRRKRSEG